MVVTFYIVYALLPNSLHYLIMTKANSEACSRATHMLIELELHLGNYYLLMIIYYEAKKA